MKEFWRDKQFVIFLVLILLAIGIRLVGINQAFFDDEIDYIVTTQITTFYGLNNVVLHAPLVTWINMIPALFGMSTWLFRLIPIIFGLLTIIFTFLIAKKIYNKRVALFSVAIMAFSFYHILASLQIGDEGAILAFFYTFAFYSYLRYEEGNKVFYWLTGISAGLAMLAKESSLMLLGVLTLYIFSKEKKMFTMQNARNTFLKILPIAIIAFLFFSIYLILSYLNPVNVTNNVKETIMQALGIGFSFQGLSLLLFWAGPLLLGLFVLSLLKYEKKDRLFFIWILSALIIYLFFIHEGDHSRYFMNIIPALAILGGNFLSKIKFTKKSIALGAFIFIVFFIILSLLNIGVFDYVPRTFDSYIAELKSFNTAFLFTYTTSSGPLFLISFFSIIFSWLWSLFFLIFSIAWIKKRLKYFGKLMFIAFLAVSFSFNVFLVQEHLFHNFHANPSNVIKEMVKYPYSLPVYSDNTAILFYLNNNYPDDISSGNWYYTGTYGEYIDSNKVKEGINNKGGTVFLLNYPILPETSPILDLVKDCKLEKSFSDKGINLGYVYKC
ncbi:MAG TPA: glycosyltransferase family 39 protein [Candidatus Nanoarchaeia archaeon]|nr:glycosyltransferase family 39 protein [Candidatus Nanoarchaeia archaeon]